ncbi:sugar ABC transporter substrate-binding protein [bacterium]|nr:sugar ABC transporter substrate-binding protein [bacterium]
MKNYLFFALVVVLFVSLLGVLGCTKLESEDGLTHIEVWTIALKPKFTSCMEGLFAKFEEDNPGIKIDWIDLPQQNIVQKLMASIAGGVAPDLVNLNASEAISLAQRHSLAAISDLVTPEEEGEYFPNLWQAANCEGKVYAFPWYVSTRVLIYNRDLLQKAGWPVDKPPQSRVEAVRLAEIVHRRSPNIYGFFPVVRLLDDWQMEELPVYDKRSGLALFAGKEQAELLGWYADLYRREIIPKEVLIEGYTGALERYKQGNLALLEAGPQLLLQIKADAPEVYKVTDVAKLPWSSKGLLPASLMNFVIPQSSKHKELAVKLGLFLTSWQNQLAFAKEVPLLTSTIKSTEDKFFIQGRGEPLQDKAIRISLQQLPYARDFSLKLSHSKELERLINRGAEKAIYGEVEPLPALQSTALEWNEIVGNGR